MSLRPTTLDFSSAGRAGNPSMGSYGLLGGPVRIGSRGCGSLRGGARRGGTLARQPAEGLGKALGIAAVIFPRSRAEGRRAQPGGRTERDGRATAPLLDQGLL